MFPWSPSNSKIQPQWLALMRSTWGLYVVPLCFGRANCSALSPSPRGHWTASKVNNLNQTTCLIYNSLLPMCTCCICPLFTLKFWNFLLWILSHTNTTLQTECWCWWDMCYFVHTHGSWNDKKHTSESNWITPSQNIGHSLQSRRCGSCDCLQETLSTPETQCQATHPSPFIASAYYSIMSVCVISWTTDNDLCVFKCKHRSILIKMLQLLSYCKSGMFLCWSRAVKSGVNQGLYLFLVLHFWHGMPI